MERAYHQEEAEQGPIIFERLSDLSEAVERLGEFTDIRGWEVINHTGDIVGEVDELYINPKTDIIVMAGINFEAKRVLVPVDQLEIINNSQISIMTTPEIVEGAPEFVESGCVDAMAFHDYWCQAAESQGSPQPAREQVVTVVGIEEEE